VEHSKDHFKCLGFFSILQHQACMNDGQITN